MKTKNSIFFWKKNNRLEYVRGQQFKKNKERKNGLWLVFGPRLKFGAPLLCCTLGKQLYVDIVIVYLVFCLKKCCKHKGRLTSGFLLCPRLRALLHWTCSLSLWPSCLTVAAPKKSVKTSKTLPSSGTPQKVV